MLAILVTLLCAPALIAWQTTPQSTGQAAQSDLTGSISGVVKDAGTGAPLPGAILVTIIRSKAANGTTSKRVKTTADAQGRYRLSDLPAGSCHMYVVSADRLGPKGFRIVTLRAGEHLASIDFALQPYGVISGKVLDDNKEPVTLRRGNTTSWRAVNQSTQRLKASEGFGDPASPRREKSKLGLAELCK